MCQMTANACDTPVKGGPIEATVIGNIIVQLIASGDIKDMSEAREIIARSEVVLDYTPTDTHSWQTAYENKFKNIIL